MADDMKQIFETSHAGQAKSDTGDEVVPKSHGSSARPVPPIVAARKPLFRS